MGNCLLGGMGECNNEVIRVVNSNGGIMEFYAPVTVESITDEFPGHGIFRSHDLFWNPLPHNQVLLAGESYYLLALQDSKSGKTTSNPAQVGHVRSNSVPHQSLVAIPPYRMSLDSQQGLGLLKRSYTKTSESFPCSRYYGSCGGFWKVKLVISPQKLLNILSEEGKTEELIDSVRAVAKCGNNMGVLDSMPFSDQWSLSSSSRN